MRPLLIALLVALLGLGYLFLNSSAAYSLPLKEFFVLVSLAYVSEAFKIKAVLWLSSLAIVFIIINVPQFGALIIGPAMLIAFLADLATFPIIKEEFS